MKTLMRHVILGVLLLTQVPAKAEDIDLFVASTLADADKPNILFVLDNTANWNTNFAPEMAALDYVFKNMKSDTFRVGIMMFTETGGGNTGNDGAYVRAAVREMTSITQPLYGNMILSFDKLADKGNGAKAGIAMAEAYLYFSGGKPDSGNNKNKTDYTGSTFGTAQDKAVHALPENALTAKNGTKYKTPIGSGCAKNFIIYISNGPASDNNADTTRSKNLLTAAGGSTTAIPLTPNGMQSNMNDEWAKFMREKLGTTIYALDISPGLTGQGPAWTEALKSMSKRNGGGEYFAVNGGDATAVAVALMNVLNEIQAVNSVFASSTLPVNADTQGVFLNQVFYGMFRPDAASRPRWDGNIKQYKFGFTDSTQTEVELKDANNNPAVSSTTDFMEACARSYWAPSDIPPAPNDFNPVTDPQYEYWSFSPRIGCRNALLDFQYDSLNYGAITDPNDFALDRSDVPDGNLVEKGGHAGLLRLTKPSNRYSTTCDKTFADCNASNGLYPYNATNTDIANADLGLTGPAAARNTLIEWSRGDDNGSGNGKGGALVKEKDGAGTMRPSVHGDVLHSRPLAINYDTSSSPDVIVFYGANDGFLRAIDGSDSGSDAGRELWSFMPPEFFYDEVNKLGNIERLRQNSPENYYPKTPEPSAIQKAYGFDGPLTSYRADTDANGKYDDVWIFGGLRRGGRALYGFDVSDMNVDPTATKLLFKVGCPNNGVVGDPYPTNDTDCTPGYENIGQTWSSPVVVKSYDDKTQVKLVMGGGYDNCEDLDSATPVGCFDKGDQIFVIDGKDGKLLSDTNLVLPSDRGVVGDVSFIRDSSGFITYGYAADMGGNIYRISGIDENTPINDTAPDKWTLTQIAQLGCNSSSTCTPNRKFMFAPELVVDSSKGLVWILIGSGDREKPLMYYKNAYGVENYFFGLVDKPADANWYASSACSNMNCVGSLTKIDGSSSASPTTISQYGYYLTMRKGEQVINKSVTIYGVSSFGTHTPADPDNLPPGTCTSLGTARSYEIYYKNAGGINGEDRSEIVDGGGLLSTFTGGQTTIDGKTVTIIDKGKAGAKMPPNPAAASAAKGKVYWNVEQ